MLVSTRHMVTVGVCISALLVASGLRAQTESWITGTVTDSGGAPIAKVTVTATTQADPEYRAETVTSKKGKFRLQVANAALAYELSLAREGYAPLVVQVQPTAGVTTTVDAVMVAAETLQARREGGQNPAAAAYQEGVDAFRAGDLETAVARLRRTVELAPDVAEPHAWLAQALLGQGEHASAAAEAERALELAPAEPRALYVRYQAARALGDDERAAEALDQLKGSEGAAAAAKRIFNEGVAAYTAGDMATARTRFEVATELDPALPEAYGALGEIARLEGKLEQSLAMADRVLELRPGDPAALRLRLTVLFGVQRVDELRPALDELVAADPEWAASRLPEVARAAFNENLMAAAAVLYEKVLELDPADTKARYTLGMCYFNLGETERAREAFTRFLELAPDDPDAEAARSMLGYLK